jgi:hypothetical protein
MAEHSQPQDSPEDAAAPVPNRRERRGGKSAASVPHGGKSAMPHRFAPVAPPRQYSTRRRSG